MFFCENCENLVPVNQPENHIVTKKREKVYDTVVKYGPNRGTSQQVTGWEIVKEIKVCPSCFTKMTGQEALLAIEKPEVKKVIEPVMPRRDNRNFRPRNNSSRWDSRPVIRPPEVKRPIVEKVNNLKIVR
jgi:hypothetical protein